MAYNPFWNQYDTREFCDDLLPCEDNTHNVGSSDQRWKDGFFGGTVEAGSFAAVSDIRLKKNISVINDPMNTLRNIHGVSYKWKHSNSPASGVIAQEVAEAAPECIVKGEDGYLRVDYNSLIGYCIEGIRSLDKKINGKTHSTSSRETVGENTPSKK